MPPANFLRRGVVLNFSFLAGRKLMDLEANLTGVNGYTGRGEIEYSAWKNGARRMEVELKGVAGQTADIYVDGTLAKTVPLRNGAVDHTFDSSRGDDVPALCEGARIEIRQNGDLILEGRLIPD